MPKPLAICIENLNARSNASRYVRCVALVGRQPGLRLDAKGNLKWKRDNLPTCEVWVSADDCLILYRQEGMAEVTLQRLGRSLQVPFAKPVVLLDQDQITIGRKHLRVHVHGIAAAISPPSPLAVTSGTKSRPAQAAASAIIGAALAVAGCTTTTPTVDIRDNPPEVMMPSETPTPTIEIRDQPPAPLPPSETPTLTPTIEVRDFPPTATAPKTPVDMPTVSEVIRSQWHAAQAFDLASGQTWITGTLTIEDSAYTFEPAQEVAIPSLAGVLDFFFTHPSGQVKIDYPQDVTPEESFAEFTFGETLATLTFQSGSEATLLALFLRFDSLRRTSLLFRFKEWLPLMALLN